MTRTLRRAGAAGMTLIELMVVCGILAPVLLVITSSTGVVTRTISVQETQGRVANQAAAACRRLAEMVEPASLTSLRVKSGYTWIAPAAGVAYTTLRFQALNRLANGGAMQLDPNRTLTFARDRTEAANGRDDDGDGLVDEGSIELTNTDGSRSVVVSGVESISYSIAGRVLTLAIQVGARDSARRVHRSRHQLSISLRNN